MRKLENLISLDRVTHLEKFISEHGEGVTPEQAAIFEKHYMQMNKTGIIPDEVSNAFGVRTGLKFNHLLAEVGGPHQIYKKGKCCLMQTCKWPNGPRPTLLGN